MVVKYALTFFIGFFSCAILFMGYLIVQDSLTSNEVSFPTGFSVADVRAPSDKISERDIVILEDMVILRISNTTLSSYAPTGSMKPLFDEGANGIRVKPDSEEEIEVGDIVSFRSEDKLIVHRVVQKGIDSEGLYFVTRGDNNTVSDEKVRFSDIEYVTIGVLW